MEKQSKRRNTAIVWARNKYLKQNIPHDSLSGMQYPGFIIAYSSNSDINVLPEQNRFCCLCMYLIIHTIYECISLLYSDQSSSFHYHFNDIKSGFDSRSEHQRGKAGIDKLIYLSTLRATLRKLVCRYKCVSMISRKKYRLIQRKADVHMHFIYEC